MKRYFISAMLCIAALLAGCKQADQMTRTPIFKVLGPDGTDASAVAINGKAQYVDFKVYASELWNAQVSGSSAFVLPVSSGGSGTTVCQLKVEANESGAQRVAVVDFTLGNVKKTFTVTQEQQKPYLDVNPVEYQASAEGEEFTISVDTNQSEWDFKTEDDASWITVVSKDADKVVFSVPENTKGPRSVDYVFYAVSNPDLVAICSISQNKVADPPVADMLDVIFNADRSAKDISAMGMKVDSDRLDENVSVKKLDKYNCYAACFNNSSIARTSLDKGYYRVPYVASDKFGTALSNGFTYELVFCPYYDQQAADNKQVKPFSATQAGGTGMCFRAGSGEINFECHVGGGWKELYSGIIPVKNQYYHVIGIYDKDNEIVTLYVDGVKKASVSASGQFKHMDTSVDARWFGIGADPNGSDKGEASFFGEVVIARLYSRPISYDEVRALYKLVK